MLREHSKLTLQIYFYVSFSKNIPSKTIFFLKNVIKMFLEHNFLARKITLSMVLSIQTKYFSCSYITKGLS